MEWEGYELKWDKWRVKMDVGGVVTWNGCAGGNRTECICARKRESAREKEESGRGANVNE